jgi:predicted small lipoprotein YifL
MRSSLLFACLLLCACGQKGNLYLPDESRPVVVPATPQASPATAPADDTGAQSDEERRKRAQQTAPADDTTGN